MNVFCQLFCFWWLPSPGFMKIWIYKTCGPFGSEVKTRSLLYMAIESRWDRERADSHEAFPVWSSDRLSWRLPKTASRNMRSACLWDNFRKPILFDKPFEYLLETFALLCSVLLGFGWVYTKGSTSTINCYFTEGIKIEEEFWMEIVLHVGLLSLRWLYSAIIKHEGNANPESVVPPASKYEISRENHLLKVSMEY